MTYPEYVRDGFERTVIFGRNELRNVQNRTNISDIRKLDYQRSAINRVIEQLQLLNDEALDLIEEALEESRAS